jgi:hypothetical protein
MPSPQERPRGPLWRRQTGPWDLFEVFISVWTGVAGP